MRAQLAQARPSDAKRGRNRPQARARQLEENYEEVRDEVKVVQARW